MRRISGFTLIEVLVVLAVIGLLISLATPQYFERLEVAREQVLRENLKVMRSAIDRFHADLGRYPTKLTELVERKYLRQVPIDPVTERDDTWLEVAAADAEPGVNGVADVRSGAEGEGRKGQAYGQL